MNLKFTFPLIIFFSNILFSQNGHYTECYALKFNDTLNGKVKNRIFTCKMFDWKIKIPSGYEILQLKMNKEFWDRGFDEIAIPTSDPKLFNFKADPYYLIEFGIQNSCAFSATYESLVGKEKISLEEHKKLKMQSLNEIYSKVKEAKAIITSSNMKIGKYDFYMIQTKVYDSKNSELAITQELYNCYINTNVLFSVTINYIKEADGKLLKDNFISSFNN